MFLRVCFCLTLYSPFFLTYKLDVVAIVIDDIAAAPIRVTTSTTAEVTVIKKHQEQMLPEHYGCSFTWP